ncbi:hypothetical protein BDV26DRAFT_16182 [Aspergillus bertholletiae]|uniref:Thioester reductase (TE) domain-containing protein n=1 Tax=Aspergillus bertholletiae TaxID=1226010 RepID=A0A5N7BKN6_9EURO|nr:hypothetical protein BDV26DRAFT_16182 [Aspergillus bertholletiae]
MQGPNVRSIRALIALAAPRRVPVHYVSSGGVFFMHGVPTPCPTSCPYFPPDDGSNGYLSTKWATKRILENAAKQISIPVTIHRLMPVAPKIRSRDQEKALTELCEIAKKLHVTMRSSNIHGHMDLMKADELASNIITTIYDCSAGHTIIFPGCTICYSQHVPVPYVHHPSSVRLATEDLASIWDQSLGEENGAKIITGPEWIGLAKQAGFSYIVAYAGLSDRERYRWGSPYISSMKPIYALILALAFQPKPLISHRI